MTLKKNHSAIGHLILPVFLIMACNAVRGDESPIALLDSLSKAFAADTLTVAELEKRFGVIARQAENKQYWSLDAPAGNLRLTANAINKNTSLIALSFYTNDLTQLSLADLENRYGKFTVIVSSKTSWVDFNGGIWANQRRIHITAHLYYSHPDAASPVLSVSLRKE